MILDEDNTPGLARIMHAMMGRVLSAFLQKMRTVEPRPYEGVPKIDFWPKTANGPIAIIVIKPVLDQDNDPADPTAFKAAYNTLKDCAATVFSGDDIFGFKLQATFTGSNLYPTNAKVWVTHDETAKAGDVHESLAQLNESEKLVAALVKKMMVGFHLAEDDMWEDQGKRRQYKMTMTTHGADISVLFQYDDPRNPLTNSLKLKICALAAARFKAYVDEYQEGAVLDLKMGYVKHDGAVEVVFKLET